MPVEKISRRDDLLTSLLGGNQAPSEGQEVRREPEDAVADPVRGESDLVAKTESSAEVAPATPAGGAAAEVGPNVAVSPRPRRQREAPVTSTTDVNAPTEMDQRLKTAWPDPTRSVPKVQLANRIPLTLRERIDRHRQRTGESINSLLERVLDLAMEVAEREAGVDSDGRRIEDSTQQ